MGKPQLTVVAGDLPPATALDFAEAVRAVVDLSRRGGLVAPVFRSPPRDVRADRTIRRRGQRPPVVAIRRLGRPLPAVQADVIEAVVVANSLDCERADRFRRAAWATLEGGRVGRGGSPSGSGGPGRSRHVA
jgi:hypothetical protein